MVRKIDYINAIYTQVVNEYLQTGWTIFTQTMSGTQGEKAKIDLTNGNKVYRILMIAGNEYLDNRWSVDTLEINVLAYDVPQNTGRTLWNNEGQIIKNITFYKIDKYSSKGIYVETRAEIQEIQDKQMKRYRNSDYYRYDDWKEVEIRPAYLDKVRDICRTFRGYGKVKRAMIVKLEKSSRGEYRVEFTPESGKGRLIIKKIGGQR